MRNTKRIACVIMVNAALLGCMTTAFVTQVPSVVYAQNDNQRLNEIKQQIDATQKERDELKQNMTNMQKVRDELKQNKKTE